MRDAAAPSTSLAAADAAPGFLFVYGTLRRSTGTPHAELLHSTSIARGTASYGGRMYLVHDEEVRGGIYYPAVVPGELEDERIHGEIYELPADAAERAKLLDALDRYEHRFPDDSAGSEYLRVPSIVVTDDGRQVEAWIYLYNRPVEDLPRLELRDFLEFRRG